MLLAIAVGSLLALPLSGPIVAPLRLPRAPSRRWRCSAAAGLVTVAARLPGRRRPGRRSACSLFGFATALGRRDERPGRARRARLGRAIMPRFHAGFSLGTVAGALVGAAMVALGVPVTVAPAGGRGARRDRAAARGARLPRRSSRPRSTERRGRPRCAAWREPRTLLIGVFVLAFAFAEGAGNDWISVAMIDDHGAGRGRHARVRRLPGRDDGRPLVRPGLLDRYGRVPTVRVLAAASRSPACAVRLRLDSARWRSPARCCGASASRSASRSA